MDTRLFLPCCAALVLLGTSTPCAAHMTVFGLPLGGKLAPALAVCPRDLDKAQALCWVERPVLTKEGHRVGTVHMPQADRIPLWAANASFEFTLLKNGVLDEISVSTVDAQDRLAIAKSIAARFGAPTYGSQAQAGGPTATWPRPDIHIEVQCGQRCRVDFRSPGAQARRDRPPSTDVPARRPASDAARPLSP